MDALRVWMARAANSEVRGNDAVCESSDILQHRAAAERGNLGGMVASIDAHGAAVVLRFTAVEYRLEEAKLEPSQDSKYFSGLRQEFRSSGEVPFILSESPGSYLVRFWNLGMMSIETNQVKEKLSHTCRYRGEE